MATATYIYDAIRTARAKAKPTGGLHDLLPADLLRALYLALESRTGLEPSAVDEVVLGCVTQTGEQAANIAKTSILYAGWPATISGLTINRFCSSGVDAINLASLKVAAGQDQLAVAGGVEMMSRVRLLSDNPVMLTSPDLAMRSQSFMMGSGADLIASLYGVTRAQADTIALRSQHHAARAQANGWFTSVVAVDNPHTGQTITADECIRPNLTLDDLAALKPAFEELGAQGSDRLQLAAHPHLEKIEHIHTAGNSPAMADAAALLLIGNADAAAKIGVQPRARIRGAANATDDPMMVVSGCVAATKKLLKQEKLTSEDIDIFEIHEAFAATVVKIQRDLDIPDDKLNVNGGVIALGHPMGATGAIMAGMLLDEMERRDLALGVVATSGASGSGSALLLERSSS